MKENILIALGGLVVIALGAVMLYAVWQDAHSPHFQLSKSEWHCTKTQTYTTTIIINGKVMPQVQTRCTEYQSK